jgi:predicted TIM-barrel fold metal-dependent hydrolase
LLLDTHVVTVDAGDRGERPEGVAVRGTTSMSESMSESMRKVSIASADGHAAMPTELWPEYLEASFHEYLPALEAEDAINSRAMHPLNDMMMVPALDVIDGDGAYRDGGWAGAWDKDVRLAQMDREGVATEIVYHGLFRVSDLGFSVMNGTYPPELVDAGARAYDRWAHDTFGDDDRLLLVGAMGSCLDRDATLAELRWVAEHGFVGTYAPGFLAIAGQPPLDDEFWDPVWALYAELGLAVIVHGGYGMHQGAAYEQIATACRDVEASGGSDTDLIIALTSGIFGPQFFNDLSHRRALWRLMLGGVFDRHPELKLMLTEVRADWIPATLRHLDEVVESHGADLPTEHRPSELWRSNCVAGISFMHRSEAEMRDEIGVDTMCFGRDYPHAEGTWPNTVDYLRDLFAGVPEPDVRKILGENLIRFLGLDPARIAEIAERVGPELVDVTAAAPVDPALVAHLADRCGYLRPAEGASRLLELDPMIDEDLSRIAAAR